MRIKLAKGKQEELILAAKGMRSWDELAKLTVQNSHYLATELRKEHCLLSDRLYDRLCQIAKKGFDKYIVNKYEDNWGRKKGGELSSGHLYEITLPKKDEKLAEFIGAVLGDGHVCYYTKNKSGVYQVKIAGDYKADKEYHDYLDTLATGLFSLKTGRVVTLRNNERFLILSSKKLVEFMISNGLKAGDKIKNRVTMPAWIWTSKDCLKACVRGLIDTDGSIFRMSRRDSNLLRISFTNYNKRLLEDARKAFIILGFAPTKIIQNKRFFISRQADISKYLKEVGFSNSKHNERLYKFTHSPVV